MIICHPKIKSSFCPCKADQRHMYGQKTTRWIVVGTIEWLQAIYIYKIRIMLKKKILFCLTSMLTNFSIKGKNHYLQ